MKKWKIAGLALVVITGLLMAKGFRKEKRVVVEVFGGLESFQAFQAATLTAQSLNRVSDDSQTNNLFHQYVRGKTRDIAPAATQNLKELLTRGKSYTFSEAEKACIVDYGVLLIATTNLRTQYFALCFTCNQIGVFNDDLEESKPVNVEYDFDPMRKPLVQIIKEVFPNDEKIQGLKEQL